MGPIPFCVFFLFWFCLRRATPRLARLSSYGHIKVRAAHPIRTANLSTFELNQYYSGGPCGNLECCTAHSFLLFYFLFFIFFLQKKKNALHLPRIELGTSR